MQDRIVELIDEVKASFPNAEEIVVFGTKEYINKIKDYIPSDITVQILPANYFPKPGEEPAYIVPINNAKPLKIARLKMENKMTEIMSMVKNIRE